MSRVNIPKTLEHHHFLLLGFLYVYQRVCLGDLLGTRPSKILPFLLPTNGGDGTGLNKKTISGWWSPTPLGQYEIPN